MASKREAILAALLTRVSAEVSAYRSREEAIKRAEMPVAVIQPVTDNADPAEVRCKVDRTLTVAVSLWVHGDIPDQTADATLCDIFAAIMADTSLGGLAIDVQVLSDDFRLAATDGAVVSTYAIRYRHSEADLTQ